MFPRCVCVAGQTLLVSDIAPFCNNRCVPNGCFDLGGDRVIKLIHMSRFILTALWYIIQLVPYILSNDKFSMYCTRNLHSVLHFSWHSMYYIITWKKYNKNKKQSNKDTMRVIPGILILKKWFSIPYSKYRLLKHKYILFISQTNIWQCQ